jgi:SAM-dependent methyltransferase
MIYRDINDYVKNYSNQNHYDFEKHQVHYRRKNLLELLKQYPCNSILEIGCGSEPFFQFFNQYDKYVIVEPSDIFCRIANQLITDKNKIKIFNDFIENVNLNEQFNFVIISSLLHEVADPSIILESIKQLLTQNSIVYINVPNAKSFHRLLAYESNIIDSIYCKSETQIKFQQTTTFDIDSLKELVLKEGYEIIDFGSYFIKPFTHTQMIKLLENNIIDERILDGLNNMIKYFPDNGSEIYVCCKIKSDKE